MPLDEWFRSSPFRADIQLSLQHTLGLRLLQQQKTATPMREIAVFVGLPRKGLYLLRGFFLCQRRNGIDSLLPLRVVLAVEEN